MNDQQAKRYIVGSMAATAALASARDLTGGKVPRLRVFVAVVAAGAVLAMLSELSADFAGMFALLILTSAIFLAGEPTYNAMRSWFASEPDRSTTTASGAAAAPASSSSSIPPGVLV